MGMSKLLDAKKEIDFKELHWLKAYNSMPQDKMDIWLKNLEKFDDELDQLKREIKGKQIIWLRKKNGRTQTVLI